MRVIPDHSQAATILLLLAPKPSRWSAQNNCRSPNLGRFRIWAVFAVNSPKLFFLGRVLGETLGLTSPQLHYRLCAEKSGNPENPNIPVGGRIGDRGRHTGCENRCLQRGRKVHGWWQGVASASSFQSLSLSRVARCPFPSSYLIS